MCNRPFRWICAAATAGIVLLLSGCGKPELVSQWRGERSIVIDGDDGDWRNARHLLEKENLVYGMLNDAEYLYLYFNLSDRRRQMQIARSGLSVWLDANGGKGRSFGVHYPLAMKETDLPETGPGLSGGGRGRGGGRSPGGRAALDPAQLDRLMERLVARRDFQILGPLSDQRTSSSGRIIAGIEVAASWSEGRLIYELKVPLTRDAEHAYAVGVREGKPLGVGIEAPLPDFRGGRRGGGGFAGGPGGRGRGGFGGGRGGGPGLGSRGGRGGGSSRPEPLELWAKLKLAGAAEGGDGHTPDPAADP